MEILSDGDYLVNFKFTMERNLWKYMKKNLRRPRRYLRPDKNPPKRSKSNGKYCF